MLLNLGTKLKAIRKEQKLSVAQVAKKTGIAPQTIIQLEESGRPIRFPVMYQIAECLNYKLEFRLSKAKD
jgi:transcriptional regulator with XRE-family HTH domain